MIRMDGDEGKGVAHFPTSLWWSGNAVRLQASHDATGVYFRQPQSEEPVLQSLMMLGGDSAVLWQVSACVCACVVFLFFLFFFFAWACGLESDWEYIGGQDIVCLCKFDVRWRREKWTFLHVRSNETIKPEKLRKVSARVCASVCACVRLTTSLGRLCRSSKGLSRVLVSTFRMTTSSNDRLRTR